MKSQVEIVEANISKVLEENQNLWNIFAAIENQIHGMLQILGDLVMKIDRKKNCNPKLNSVRGLATSFRGSSTCSWDDPMGQVWILSNQNCRDGGDWILKRMLMGKRSEPICLLLNRANRLHYYQIHKKRDKQRTLLLIVCLWSVFWFSFCFDSLAKILYF